MNELNCNYEETLSEPLKTLLKYTPPYNALADGELYAFMQMRAFALEAYLNERLGFTETKYFKVVCKLESEINLEQFTPDNYHEKHSNVEFGYWYSIYVYGYAGEKPCRPSVGGFVVDINGTNDDIFTELTGYLIRELLM